MDAITIENANKIRASMGLAPLPVPASSNGDGLAFKTSQPATEQEVDTTSTLEKREAAAGDNWRKIDEERKDKADRQARKDALKKQREKELRTKTLIGRTLADSDGEEELDTRAWLISQKQRQNKVEEATRRQEAAVAAEAERAKRVKYTSKDLAGIKVGHDVEAFGDGEQILTLKDAAIGEEDEEDELEAAELNESERAKRNVDLRRGKPIYDPTEEDEDGERTLLKQYDDEDETRKRKRFTLDDKGQGQKIQQNKSKDQLGRVKISLDLLPDDTPISDYAELKIRKHKKSKHKTSRKRPADEEGEEVKQTGAPDVMAMDQDPPERPAYGRHLATEEDDKQLQLAQQRRQALKQRKKTSAAELARELREEAATQDHADGQEDDGEPGMILDETSEFVAHLERPGEGDDAEAERRSKRARTDAQEPIVAPDSDGDVPMSAAPESGPEPASTAIPTDSTSIFDQEQSLDGGVAASLSLLRDRGVIRDAADPQAMAKARARAEFSAYNQKLIDEYDVRARQDRERDRASGRLENMSAADRDAYQRQANESREAYLSTLRNRHYQQHYKPDVSLKYTDELGRDLNQKEAFRHLSHMFHGKGSGKGKTESRLKKIANEKKAAAKSVLSDAGERGMRTAQGQQARKNNTAGVRLQ